MADQDLQQDAGRKRAQSKPGERRVLILQALAAMLQHPKGEKITTAALAAQLQVAGLARELAARSELLAVEGDTLRLRVALKTLADQGNVERLKNALSQHFGRPLRLRVEVGSTAGPTATALAEQARAERHERAAAAIYADPFVQQVMKELGATVDPASIRPVGPE